MNPKETIKVKVEIFQSVKKSKKRILSDNSKNDSEITELSPRKLFSYITGEKVNYFPKIGDKVTKKLYKIMCKISNL